MALPNVDPDAIERFLSSLSTPAQLGLGAVMVGNGILLSRLVAKRAQRWLPRPIAASPRPALPATRAYGSPLLRGIVETVWRMRQGPPAALQPLLFVLGLAVAFATPQLASSLGLLGGAAPTDGVLDLRAMATACCLVAAALTLFLVVWLRVHGGALRDLGVVFRTAGRPVLFALLLYVAFAPAQIGALAIERGLYALFDLDVPRQRAVVAFAGDATLHADLTILVGIVVAASWYEELLFRGIALPLLRRAAPLAIAIALDALLFTLLHDGGRLPVFVLGTALAWLMARTGNLLAPVAFHLVHNAVVLVLLATTGGS